jgi:hypothetical protein
VPLHLLSRAPPIAHHPRHHPWSITPAPAAPQNPIIIGERQHHLGLRAATSPIVAINWTQGRHPGPSSHEQQQFSGPVAARSGRCQAPISATAATATAAAWQHGCLLSCTHAAPSASTSTSTSISATAAGYERPCRCPGGSNASAERR